MTNTYEITQIQRSLVLSAAWLMVVGLLIGILVAAAMTGQLNASPQSMLAAHLNGLLGCFWLIGVAWTLPMMTYRPTILRLFMRLIILSVWANCLFTLLKAFWQVSGLAYTGDPKNNLIAGGLQVLVVLPALVGAIAWAWGLRSPKR